MAAASMRVARMTGDGGGDGGDGEIWNQSPNRRFDQAFSGWPDFPGFSGGKTAWGPRTSATRVMPPTGEWKVRLTATCEKAEFAPFVSMKCGRIQAAVSRKAPWFHSPPSPFPLSRKSASASLLNSPPDACRTRPVRGKGRAHLLL